MKDDRTLSDPADLPPRDPDVAAWLAECDALRAEIGQVPGPTSTEMLRADRDRDDDRYGEPRP